MNNKTNQELVNNNKTRDRRESRGRVIAMSRTIYRITKSDVFYVESETTDGMFYYIMFDTAKGFEWCSCPHFSNRSQKCKHIFAIEYAIKGNVVIDTDTLPNSAKKDCTCNVKDLPYTKEDYSF